MNSHSYTPQVQKFDENIIETYLKAKELYYLRDPDGDYRIDFGKDNDTGQSLKVWFTREGGSNTIFVLRVFADQEIPKDEWEKAFVLCNAWNASTRWPKAYVHIKDADEDEPGKIVLEENLDLEQGIHQALFDDFVNTVLMGAFQFWQKVAQEQIF